MAKYAFLTDEWLEEARKIREEPNGDGEAPAHTVKMNMIIIDCPPEASENGIVEAHMDTTGGDMHMDLGHIDDPELTATLDYDTAKAILVEGNAQAGMQAFMSGKIKVQGDMTKLMAMQQQGTSDPGAEKIAAKIQEITA